MKKLSLLVSGLALSTLALAQKPSAEVPMSLEGQIGWNSSTLSFANVTGANINTNIATGGLRYRYFVSDNIAARVSLGVSNTKTTDNYYENEGDNSGDAGTFETKLGLLNIGIGGEYHFDGTDKLSPYVGADINIASGKYTEDGSHADNVSWVAANYTEAYEAKASGFGLNLVAGTDYYFAENFYAGLELGLGWNSYTVKEDVRTITVGTTTSTTTGNESKSSSIGNNVVGTFRLGWRF